MQLLRAWTSSSLPSLTRPGARATEMGPPTRRLSEPARTPTYLQRPD